MKRAEFIVLEGLDGCGKSTLARHLGRRLGARVMATPHGLDSATRRVMERHCHGIVLARQLFYASTVVAASELVRAQLRAGQHVVMDRYWLSTMTYHDALGSDARLEDVARHLVAATATVFLDVPVELRRSRLIERGALRPHDRDSLDPAAAARIRERYLDWGRHRVAGRFVALDASRASVDELALEVITRLGLTPAEERP